MKSPSRFDIIFFQIAEYHINDKKNEENLTSSAWMQKKKQKPNSKRHQVSLEGYYADVIIFFLYKTFRILCVIL